MPYTHIAFDLDGTLIDTAPDILATLSSVIKEAGLEVETLDKTVIGPPLEEMINTLLPNLDKDKQVEIAAAHRARYIQSSYEESTVYPGIPPLLRRLRQEGKHLFVATNKPVGATRRILEKKGLLPWFDDLACSDSVPGRKLKKSDMLAYLGARHGFQPGTALMVGDSTLDIRGGKETGIDTVAVLYGYGRKEQLLAASPHFVVEDPRWVDILAWPALTPVDPFL